jgi:hypothetical protein
LVKRWRKDIDIVLDVKEYEDKVGILCSFGLIDEKDFYIDIDIRMNYLRNKRYLKLRKLK